MTQTPFTSLFRLLYRIGSVRPASELGDGVLLERYLSQRDEAAFEILL